MAITLGSNIASLRGQRQLSRTSEELGTVFQRLSSGQRINKASDDAAGLSIADSLSAQSRIYNQGVRNLNDGLSLLSIADSAIENLSGIVIRLQELAEQSANGVFSAQQRKALDGEAQALANEFFRISKTAEFNGQKLLTGSFGSVDLQAGVGASSVLSAGMGGAIGTGSFSAATSFQGVGGSGGEYRSLVSADFNSDGFTDIVASGQNTAGTTIGLFEVYFGREGGLFSGPTLTTIAENEGTFGLAAGDLNGDGSYDFVTAGYNESGAGQATVWLNRGNGTFYAAQTLATEGQMSNAVDLADFDGDGKLDLVTSGMTGGNSALNVFRGTSDGKFAASQSFAISNGNLNSVAHGDFDGDGKLDIAVAGFNDSGFHGAAAWIYRGRGDGTFNNTTGGTALGSGGSASEAYGIAVGDFNRDGKDDIATAKEDTGVGYVGIHLGSSTGLFTNFSEYETNAVLTRGVTVGDLNGDGFEDLVTSGDNGGSGSSVVLLGGGTGSFSFRSTLNSQSAGSAAAELIDHNRDGVFDIFTAGTDGGFRAHVFRAITQNGVAPLLPFSLSTMADARQALPVLQRKLELLAGQRGQIGAFQSRIDVARNVLEVSGENFRAAESRIRDADIADESSRLVRLNILQQAASSILAQANQQPALALQLLGRA